ncbi:MAG: Asp-tRNA(Asn)/Glu-tRNA(Gln) amidotransferase subunit GatA [Campylobacter sp.]|nr:Asp-tRNA(Asn)/Glu-tRNA(Gln) amidotransferase subunit GatA [Campylobacter sp.]
MKTARQILKEIKEGKITAVQVVEESLKVIKELNPKINAFLEVFEQEALKKAAEIDAKPLDKRGRLAGLPIALKDNILYKGHKATCASKMLENFVAPYSASVVEKLLKEDAIIIGRTNMDEFAMGSSNENSAFGPVKNPHDLTRVPGGSSGGSAAAVASGMVSVALGSDTGGSVRQPAAFCGVCGVKPTYGSVSRYGLVAFASSLDQIAPITLDSRDNAFILNIISEEDKKDSSFTKPFELKEEDIKNLTIGIPTDFLAGLNAEILKALNKAKEAFIKQGLKVKEITLPYAKYSSPCYYILAGSEASSNLARFDGLRYGYTDKTAKDLEETYLKNRAAFGPEVKRRIMTGTYCLGSAHAQDYYLQAQKVRQIIKEDFKKALSEVDIILLPSTPSTAFKLGEKINNILELYLADLYTVPANIAGLPALSVPFGKDKNNLPIGVQLYGNYFEENKLYALAKILEEEK